MCQKLLIARPFFVGKSSYVKIGQQVSCTPRTALANQAAFYEEWPKSELGGTLHRVGRDLSDGNTFQRLTPPRGRKYHPDLAKLAPDGRFFENLDTVTEKELPCSPGGTYVPGFGSAWVRTYGEGPEPGQRSWDDPELRILPDPTKLNITPAMLELWAQVVTGGELESDGRFVPWDELTWVMKQKQLAAMKRHMPTSPSPAG